MRTHAAKRLVNGTTNGGDVASDTTPNPTAHAGDTRHLKDVSTELRFLPAYTSRKLRVITIGAGYSGLTLAHKFQHQHSDLSEVIDHTIYEVRSELGGTWLVNTYPGVVCDVPSHIYVFLKLWCFKICVLDADQQRLFHLTPILVGPGFSPPVLKFGHI